LRAPRGDRVFERSRLTPIDGPDPRLARWPPRRRAPRCPHAQCYASSGMTRPAGWLLRSSSTDSTDFDPFDHGKPSKHPDPRSGRSPNRRASPPSNSPAPARSSSACAVGPRAHAKRRAAADRPAG